MEADLKEQYREILETYRKCYDERVLYRASLLSKEFMCRKVDPDEIIEMHFEILEEITKKMPPGEKLHTYNISLEVLLQLITHYAHAYKGYLELQERLYHKEREINAFLEMFINIIAHDLNNPLITISGYAEILCEICEDGREYAEKIRESADKMFELLEEARTFTKVRASEVEFRTVDIADLLNEAIIELEMKAREKDIEIKKNYGKGYMVNATQFLRYAFLNIIDNAIKYSPPHSVVEISVSEERGKNWKVCVKDRGEGVPDKWKQKIFERFVRGEKTGIKGSGIGLAIAKTVVTQNKGRIWVEDNPEGGAVFCISLPKAS